MRDYMKKLAKDIKSGDKINLSGDVYIVKEVEISDIGKQGTKKVRFVLEDSNGKNEVIVRPDNYPIEKV